MDYSKVREQEEKQAQENSKQLSPLTTVLLQLLAVVFVVLHLYTAFAGNFVAQSSMHFLFALTLAYIVYPWRKSPKGKLDIAMKKLDGLFAVLAIIVNGYFLIHQERIIIDMGYLMPTTADITISIITVLLVIEAARRALGWIFPSLAVIASAYAIFGNHLINVPFLKQFAHQGYSVQEFLVTMYMGQQGIFQGSLLGVGAKTIAVFIIFGGVLLFTGGGEMFIRLSTAIAGRLTGGPAKVATLSSALFGSISGSTAANTATTGVFTIPLMKRYGYKSHFAGAVEAAASCGGQILPPIMGAAAFVLAEVTRTEYLLVVTASAIPALLFYYSIWMGVHLEAKRLDLKPIDQEDLPKIKEVLISAESPTLFVPLIILCSLLATGYTPNLAAFWAVISSVGLYILQSLIKRNIKQALANMVSACVDGAKTMSMIAVILATAQIIASVIGITGVGNKISSMLVGYGENALLLTVFLGMIVTIIMGMGVPTVAAYMLSASVIYPAFAALGLPVLASHLFILYYAILSGITPPVALAAYVAGSISGASAMKTAFTACKIGLAGFLIPYMFLFNPALLAQGSAPEIIWSVITAVIGVTALAGSTIGYLIAPVHWINRIVLLGTAVLFIHPSLTTDIIGAAGLGIVAISQWIKMKRKGAVNKGVAA